MPFPVGVKIKINVKCFGQECLAYTGKIPGLKPARVVELYAALKRRSSTVLRAFVVDTRQRQKLASAR